MNRKQSSPTLLSFFSMWPLVVTVCQWHTLAFRRCGHLLFSSAPTMTNCSSCACSEDKWVIFFFCSSWKWQIIPQVESLNITGANILVSDCVCVRACLPVCVSYSWTYAHFHQEVNNCRCQFQLICGWGEREQNTMYPALPGKGGEVSQGGITTPNEDTGAWLPVTWTALFPLFCTPMNKYNTDLIPVSTWHSFHWEFQYLVMQVTERPGNPSHENPVEPLQQERWINQSLLFEIIVILWVESISWIAVTVACEAA